MSTQAQAEHALRRVEELITTLDGLPETHARAVARDLVEAVLDLHGLGLARLTAAIAASGHGDALFETMAADHQIAALLLLHGLHPQMPEARLRQALKELAPAIRAQGAELQLVEVADGVARLRLCMPGASREEVAMLRREIEEKITETVPDLGEIAILNEVGDAPALAVAS